MSAGALVARLDAAERERRWPNLRPRDAATLILLDRTGPEPRVLMGRRHAGHVFMPGKFVFPGGRVEPGDRLAPAFGALSERAEAALRARVRRPARALGRGLALAALRETCEETGLLVGVPGHLPAPPPGEAWSPFAARGVVPCLSGVQFVARAITPPRRPRRFDTRFFCADRSGVAGEVAGIVGPESELVELVWIGMGEAARLDLPSITRTVLDELRARLEAGFSPDLPVPFYYERHGRFHRELL